MAGPWEKYQQPDSGSVAPADSGDASAAEPAGPWAKYSSPKPKLKSTSAGQAALESFGNSASLGYLPQLQGLVGSMLPNPSADVDKELQNKGFVIKQDQPSYTSERDAAIKRMQTEAQEHPVASAAGGLAGALTTGIAASALTPINAASRIGRVAQAAKAGALMGAAANPGDTEGEISGLQLGERAKNAATGAALGGATQGGLEGASKVASALANLPETLQAKAAERAFKSSGAMLKDYRRAASKPVYDAAGNVISGEDRVNLLGKYMLENGLIKPGATVEDIRDAAASLASKHGEDVSSILEKLDTAGMDAPSAQGLAAKIQEQAEPLKDLATAKPTYKTLQNLAKDVKTFSEKEAPVGVSAGEVGSLTGKGTEFLTDPKTGEVVAKFQNGNLVTQGPKVSAEMANAPTQITPTGIAAQPTGGTFKNAQAIKSFISDQVDAAGGWNTPNPSEKNLALRKAYNLVKSEMEKGAGAAAENLGDPEVLKSYLNAKSGFRNANEIADIAKDYALRKKANNSLSLTDYISGLGGAVSGAATGSTPEEKVRNAAIGLGLGAANKFGRTYGTPLLSTGMYKIGKAVASTPLGQVGEALAPGLKAVETSPVAAANAAKVLTQPSLKPSGQSQAETRWAKQGASKLGLSDEEVARLMSSPSTRMLLIQASDLSPGSKAMKSIRDQLMGASK